MNITLEEVRDALQKDDLDYVNAAIKSYMEAAKSALYIQIGYTEDRQLPENDAKAFEDLSNQYIVEFVRSKLEGVNNDETLGFYISLLDPLFNHSRRVEKYGDGKKA